MSDLPTDRPTWTPRTVTAGDGLSLAVFETGPVDAPTVLAVHGYPDDHHVWDSVAAALAPHLRIVTFDVRGAGASDVPAHRDGYELEQLADDIDTVAATLGDGPVHLLAHDWGSIQGWRAATRADAAQRFASYTSISGPDIAYASVWMGKARHTDRAAFTRQARASWYIGFFRLPYLPDLFWRSGLGHRLSPAMPARSRADAVRGLELYRANRIGSRPAQKPRRCELPVLVLAPSRDAYLTLPLVMESPRRWVERLTVREIDGGHWGWVRHPERVAGPVREFVETLGEHIEAGEHIETGEHE